MSRCFLVSSSLDVPLLVIFSVFLRHFSSHVAIFFDVFCWGSRFGTGSRELVWKLMWWVVSSSPLGYLLWERRGASWLGYRSICLCVRVSISLAISSVRCERASKMFEFFNWFHLCDVDFDLWGFNFLRSSLFRS